MQCRLGLYIHRRCWSSLYRQACSQLVNSLQDPVWHVYDFGWVTFHLKTTMSPIQMEIASPLMKLVLATMITMHPKPKYNQQVVTWPVCFLINKHCSCDLSVCPLVLFILPFSYPLCLAHYFTLFNFHTVLFLNRNKNILPVLLTSWNIIHLFNLN